MPDKQWSQAGREPPQAATLPKELSRQLISWLFGTSSWPEAGAAFGPLQYQYNEIIMRLYFYEIYIPSMIRRKKVGGIQLPMCQCCR
jgi:hypothetical protein